MISHRVRLSEVEELEPPRRKQADIWLCELDASDGCVDECRQHITLGERERAARFLSDRSRNRFIVGRAVLRRLLAAYLSKPSIAIEFAIEEHGKPGLADASLNFNVAHSEDWLLMGFSADGQIGVDIERHRPVLHEQEIARKCYTYRELAKLQSVAIETREEAFFRIWTRKEAAVKWHGSGLQLPLNEFDVPLDEQCDAEVIVPSAKMACWVRSLESPDGYSAACATSRPCETVVMRKLEYLH